MKRLILALLLAGCTTSKQSGPPSAACYKLEICRVAFHGFALDDNTINPIFNVFCIYGYDANGNKNGEAQRFFNEDVVVAWSQLHPEVKVCDKVKK